VLLMWLYFSAAVLLLGAEFSAARGRLNDPRGGWGVQADSPPGSRAKLASVLAASTVPASAALHAGEPNVHPFGHVQASDTGSAVATEKRGASSVFALRRTQARKKASVVATAAKVGRSVISAEAEATHLAALTLLGASRKAVAADRYVRKHPWKSVALAAAAGLAAASMARHARSHDTAQD